MISKSNNKSYPERLSAFFNVFFSEKDPHLNAIKPQYVLMIVGFYLLEVYIYPMRLRKQILQKMKLFYDEVRSNTYEVAG